MYLKKSKNNKTGRTYLYIADGYHDKDLFFENTDFSLKEVYNALGYLEPFKESIQHYIYDHIEEQYKPKNEAVFYDVTNYLKVIQMTV